eukprot:TRINITY_DN25809_c0_g1_i4.p3 TRINITY_DN25809_c0_g1~~TRINITY_DN25809_c0_g1_i4.p3  ORF type:complete len:100 (-),score=22.22 TRINITY_DN25809_c0_g1_i4:465-764(-)
MDVDKLPSPYVVTGTPMLFFRPVVCKDGSCYHFKPVNRSAVTEGSEVYNMVVDAIHVAQEKTLGDASAAVVDRVVPEGNDEARGDAENAKRHALRGSPT